MTEKQKLDFINLAAEREPRVTISNDDINDIISAAENKEELVQYLSSIAHPNYDLSILNKIPDEYAKNTQFQYSFPDEETTNNSNLSINIINKIIALAQQEEKLKIKSLNQNN